MQGHKISLECQAAEDSKANIPDAALAQSSRGTLVLHAQPSIDRTLHQQAEDSYRQMIRSAYLLAVDGQPLSAFKTIVSSMKANGVRVIEGFDNEKKATEFIGHLADAVRAKIGTILNNASAFAILCDSSQAKKNGSEKELVLVRVVIGGEPKYFMVALQNIHSYGPANAENLKTAIDDEFQNVILVEEYTKKVVSVTADGAAVNTDNYNDLLVQMTSDNRPWLVGIQCVLHRVELTIKDILLKHKLFKTVKDVMILLNTLMKQSANFQRHFQDTARRLNVQVYKFPNVHGIRFVNKQRKGLDVLLNNWIPLLLAIELAVADNTFQSTISKLTALKKKLANVHVLTAACLFKVILDIIAWLLLKFEDNKLLPFDIQPAVETAVSALEELMGSGESVIESANGERQMILLDNVLQAQLPKRRHNRKEVANSETITVQFLHMTNEGEADPTVIRLKNAVIPDIIDCIKDRFSSFNASIFRAMHWVDPANWHETEDTKLESIKVRESHIACTMYNFTAQRYYSFTMP